MVVKLDLVDVERSKEYVSFTMMCNFLCLSINTFSYNKSDLTLLHITQFFGNNNSGNLVLNLTYFSIFSTIFLCASKCTQKLRKNPTRKIVDTYLPNRIVQF